MVDSEQDHDLTDRRVQLFTKSVYILSRELWDVLHSPTGDGIVSTRKWTRVPTAGYAVDVNRLHVPGWMGPATIEAWVKTHRAAIDYVPNAYVGAHHSLIEGDSLFEVRVFGSFPQAVEFATERSADYIYKLEALPEIIRMVNEGSLESHPSMLWAKLEDQQ